MAIPQNLVQSKNRNQTKKVNPFYSWFPTINLEKCPSDKLQNSLL